MDKRHRFCFCWRWSHCRGYHFVSFFFFWFFTDITVVDCGCGLRLSFSIYSSHLISADRVCRVSRRPPALPWVSRLLFSDVREIIITVECVRRIGTKKKQIGATRSFYAVHRSYLVGYNMANAVRKICTKIGNGHQYLLGSTVKTSAYGAGPLMSDPVHSSTGSQVNHGRRLLLGA